MKSPWKAALYGLALVACSVGSARAESDKPARASYASDRPLEWVWMNGEAGYATANLRTFTANTETLAVGIVPTAGSGPTAGIGVGVRVVFITLGLRGRVASLRGDTPTQGTLSWQLWTLDAEAAVRIPLRHIEPYVSLGVGYASLGGFGDAVGGLQSGLHVNGANVRVGAGVDYYVTPYLTVGANLTGEVLALARKGVALSDLATAKSIGTIDEAQARVLEASGSSVGMVLALTGGAGLHF
jgi:hypothetical protein